jgi:hypothetical protein
LLVIAASCFAAQPGAAHLQEVIVVFKTHFDVGYTDMAVDVCDATQDMLTGQQFVWTLPGWPLSQILYPDQTLPRRQRVQEAMRTGRIVWHALPVTTHTESMELEEIVRGMRFSSDLSRSLGRQLPRDAKMTDVPSHTWALPTILANAGIDFMHIGGNRACAQVEAPLLFWWQGSDGSRVLTMMVRGYGTGLHPPEGWAYRTWLALLHTGDNHCVWRSNNVALGGRKT